MNNAKMPANPCNTLYAKTRTDKPEVQPYEGMTKREMIAMHVMASYVSGATASGSSPSYELSAVKAVIYADALLKELAK